ncbi:hypothetical protein [Streptacidiphilus sp. P02-A3a]|uniref:hypothetical protein n=1 Tax=Streptacidiphilus sp. P02-A3a TaxID=2704468 RepID=UPI0015FB57CF|nr:hypothetical protein [Streptacidiphilus sp. P02-A3a]QMU71709.1 hypothetical protein GXP74_29150 [Streptacidiphilus sp. P02-A3a]
MTSNRRDWWLFAGWLLTGACYLLALVTMLSIGIFVLPIPLAGTVALATRPGTGRGLPGLLSGASLPLFLLAYLNQHGPGTYCTTSATGSTCTEGMLDPWLLLAAGLLVLTAGVALFLSIRRRPVNSPAPRPPEQSAASC